MNRRSLTFSGVACGVLLVAWFMLLWSPKGSQLSDAKARRASAETKVQELETKVARLQSALEDSPQLQADLDRVRSAVPDEPYLAQFILDADDAAAKAGVEFLTITPSQPSPGVGGPTQVKLSLSAKGDYQAMLSFLDELLHMRRLLVLDGVSITPEEGGGQLNAALEGRMFTTAAPPAPPGVTTDTTATGSTATGSTGTTPTTEAPKS